MKFTANVWKDHFVKQIMLSEITQLLLFRKEHLTDHEIRQIKHLSAGDFREKTLQNKAILLYLNQHARQLGLEAPSFANPKDKQISSDKSERKQSDNSDSKQYR